MGKKYRKDNVPLKGVLGYLLKDIILRFTNEAILFSKDVQLTIKEYFRDVSQGGSRVCSAAFAGR